MATNVNEPWSEAPLMQCNKLTEDELRQIREERYGKPHSLECEVNDIVNSLIKSGATIRRCKDMVIMDIDTLTNIVKNFID
jgi:hypothetical protein